VAAYLQIAWLLLGTQGLARGGEPSRRRWRSSWGWRSWRPRLGSAGPRGTPSPPAGCPVPGRRPRLPVRRLLHPAARTPTPIGRGFVKFALTMWAADQLAYFGLSFLPRREQELLTPLSAFDVVSTAIIGIALVAWLLEASASGRCIRGARAPARAAQACVYRISEAAARCGTSPRFSARSTRAWATCCPPATSTSRSTTRLGPPHVSVLRRRARRDPAAKPLGRGSPSTSAYSPAPPRNARGLPDPRGQPRGGAHRQRLGGLAGAPLLAGEKR